MGSARAMAMAVSMTDRLLWKLRRNLILETDVEVGMGMEMEMEMEMVLANSVLSNVLSLKSRSSSTELALRPEGTASVMRAIIDHPHLQPSPKSPAKLFYNGPMFRYERPQKGRYRQVSVKCFVLSISFIDLPDH